MTNMRNNFFTEMVPYGTVLPIYTWVLIMIRHITFWHQNENRLFLMRKKYRIKISICKNLHTSHKNKPEIKNNKVDEYELNSKELSLDNALPT